MYFSAGFLILFLALCRKCPTFGKIVQSGNWILRELGFGIYNQLSKIWEIIKIGLLVMREIGIIGIEIYHFPECFWKNFKNGFKSILLILQPKLKRRNKNRKFIKNRSRRAENRNFKKLGNETIYRKPTGILKPDDDNVENVRSGRIGI